ncbi:MAG TPA: hypothetical protein DCG06_12495, partial [Deltaproteobacteria bacterium]|nr:hypothetical protein [Deltaproteobacteria bacterium]
TKSPCLSNTKSRCPSNTKARAVAKMVSLANFTNVTAFLGCWANGGKSTTGGIEAFAVLARLMVRVALPQRNLDRKFAHLLLK